jgi:hypothetical protein
MSEQDAERPASEQQPRRQARIRPWMVFLSLALVVTGVALFDASSDGDPVEPAAAPATTTTQKSTSALPTDQDMVDACHATLEARMAGNRATRGEVLWNTADVAPSTKYRGYYDVTGTGTLDYGIQTPFSFTCLVEFGPPVAVVDNGFKLRP